MLYTQSVITLLFVVCKPVKQGARKLGTLPAVVVTASFATILYRARISPKGFAYHKATAAVHGFFVLATAAQYAAS